MSIDYSRIGGRGGTGQDHRIDNVGQDWNTGANDSNDPWRARGTDTRVDEACYNRLARNQDEC
jgi:hypothetical protein